MPIYEYRCEKGHNFEVLQRISDDAATECEECGAPVERVFHPVAVHFKGSGFYNTDYGKAKKRGSGSEPSKEGGSESGSSSSDSTNTSSTKESSSKESSKKDKAKT